MSSDGKGDVQAKLVRQIETLQNSYAVASENWRGIESTLLSRIAAYEKELVEANRKESDSRRKIRDMGSKYRDLEGRFESTTSKSRELEENLSCELEKTTHLQSSLTKAEAESERIRAELSAAKESWESRIERLEADRRDNVAETSSLRSRNHSPIFRAGFEPSNTQLRRFPASPGLGISNQVMSMADRPTSRRTSTQPSHTSMSQRQDLVTSTIQTSGGFSTAEAPTILAGDQDDIYEHAVTPATPDRTINDMLSTSTAAAGPSVQLVERMSAAVRRLETEKAATKDELDRLSAQRDEARNQVVGLMHEVEEKRQAELRIQNLEKETEELNVRLQTTLEMLGEKSELVEELRADIVDMKEIYRSTLENTVK